MEHVTICKYEHIVCSQLLLFTSQTITPVNFLHSGAFFIETVHLHYVVLVLSKGDLEEKTKILYWSKVS